MTRLFKVWKSSPNNYGVIVRIPESWKGKKIETPLAIKDYLCDQGIFQWSEYKRLRIRQLPCQDGKCKSYMDQNCEWNSDAEARCPHA